MVRLLRICFEDSDCVFNRGICECGGGIGGENGCIGAGGGGPHECRNNDECPETGACSPARGTCGPNTGTVLFDCRTCADECVDDSDCAREKGEYCRFDASTSRWACIVEHGCYCE